MPKFETLFNRHWTWRSVLHLSSICTHTLFPWNIAHCFHGAVWEHNTTLLTMTIGYHSNAKLLIHIRSKRPYRRQLFKSLTPLSSTVQGSYPKKKKKDCRFRPVSARYPAKYCHDIWQWSKAWRYFTSAKFSSLLFLFLFWRNIECIFWAWFWAKLNETSVGN